jgi:hypothetical protein
MSVNARTGYKTIAINILVGLVALGSTTAGWSQSTDFSRPTPLTSVPLVLEGDGSQDISHYYSFEAGPGNILVTLDGRASKYSTNVQVRISDTNRNELGMVYLVAGNSPSSETKRLTIPKRQRLILETIEHQDAQMGQLKYSVNVSGAVHLARETGGTTAPSSAPLSDGQAPRTAPPRSGAGRLHVELRDGSTHDFEMSSVRRIVVE